MIGRLLLGSGVVGNGGSLEVTVFTIELAASFAVEWAAAFSVEWAAASVVWAVTSAAGCDVCVAWAGVEMFVVVNAAAGLLSSAVSVLAV